MTEVIKIFFSETNLKVKQALPETAELDDNIEQWGKFDGELSLPVSYMPYLTLSDELSQSFALLKADSHKIYKYHRISEYLNFIKK